VIGTAGRRKSGALAKAHGADHCINYRKENFVERVKALTGERVCRPVYDSVGKEYLHGFARLLQPRGLNGELRKRLGCSSSLRVGDAIAKRNRCTSRARPLVTYTGKRDDLVAIAKDLFDIVSSGQGEDRDQSPLRPQGTRHRRIATSRRARRRDPRY